MDSSTISVKRLRIDEHDADRDDGEHKIDDSGQALAGQEGPDGFKLPHPRHGLAGGPGLEIGQRQAEKMIEEPGAKLDVDAARCVSEDVGSKILKGHVKEADQQPAPRQ